MTSELPESTARPSLCAAPGSEVPLTPEQHLKAIFLHLDSAEKEPEPERTQQLRQMIDIALSELRHITLPNGKVSDAAH